jgi:predicted RNA-binding Zn-ribbon protein involved in translation (DUF1610 family)
VTQNYKHHRRCWACKSINLHLSDVTPGVCCPECGSQDTRKLKSEPPLWDVPESIRNKRGLYVPTQTAVCPECGDGLIATCTVHHLADGRPAVEGIEVECVSEMREDANPKPHGYAQSTWQPVREAVVKWCDARSGC